jgi:hypothetical protein
MFCKRWRTWYYTHVNRVIFRIFPQLDKRSKTLGRRAQRNRRRQCHWWRRSMRVVRAFAINISYGFCFISCYMFCFVFSLLTFAIRSLVTTLVFILFVHQLSVINHSSKGPRSYWINATVSFVCFVSVTL